MNRDSLAPPPPTVRRYNYAMPDAKPIPFDSLNLYAVLQERNFFAGARIQDIRQPEPLTVVLHLYAQRTEHRLLISADAQFARLHCISHKLPNAPTPPPFLQSLRKHIEGGIVRSIQMLGFDRIVQAEVQTREGVYRLMIELMGKHSNIILVEPTGLIRSAIKWVSPRQSEARPIRAGEPYRLPPTRVEGLLNPLAMRDDDWRALLTQMGAGARLASAPIEGLSRFTADELEAVVPPAQEHGGRHRLGATAARGRVGTRADSRPADPSRARRVPVSQPALSPTVGSTRAAASTSRGSRRLESVSSMRRRTPCARACCRTCVVRCRRASAPLPTCNAPCTRAKTPTAGNSTANSSSRSGTACPQARPSCTRPTIRSPTRPKSPSR
jgi:hypothetical protein